MHRVEITRMNVLWHIAIFFVTFNQTMSTKSEFIVKNRSSLKMGIWNSRSKLDLIEVCEKDEMDILIVEGLEVLPMAKGKVQCVKMLQMGPGNNRPFPHYHRYVKGMGKGAVYADFLDASGLGVALEACRRRHVKVLLQVSLKKELGEVKLRKSILLASLLWNSFLAEGYHYDRPFGSEFIFDGIHFVHDDALTNPVGSTMKRIREMADNCDGRRELILSNECGEKTTVIGYSDFVISSESVKVPFFVHEKAKLAEVVKKAKNFKGIVKKLSARNRFTEASSVALNTGKKMSSTICSGWKCAAVIIGILLILVLMFVLVRHYLKNKLLRENIQNEDIEKEHEYCENVE